MSPLRNPAADSCFGLPVGAEEKLRRAACRRRGWPVFENAEASDDPRRAWPERASDPVSAATLANQARVPLLVCPVLGRRSDVAIPIAPAEAEPAIASVVALR
jgi:hypothetical protein